MNALANLFIYTFAGTIVGLLTLLTKITAALLAGALLEARFVIMSGHLNFAEWPQGTRTVLVIGMGIGLTKESLEQLQVLWQTTVLITLTLIIIGLILELWNSRLLDIYPIISLLGAAPGGTSGMNIVRSEFGVGAVFAAVQTVRLITVLMVLPITIQFFATMRQISS